MCCFTVVGVFCSVCDAVKEHELLSFSLVIIMSFVRWRHITFQCIQINCDFTLTVKLPWFLLNLVWLCLTNIQAVKLWPVVWPCTIHLQQRKRASRHWRHSLWRYFSLSSTSRTKWPIFCLFVVGFGRFDSLNLVGHRVDRKKALPCVIARNLSHCAQGSLQ